MISLFICQQSLFFWGYKGVKCEKYALLNKTILRTVFAVDGRVYIGSYNEFVCWNRDS
jgi:AraC family chitin signaling transcriptional activator